MTLAKITQEQLDISLVAGCKKFRDMDLSGLDLSRQRLIDLGVSVDRLCGGDFFRSDLTGACLVGVDLFEARFLFAILHGANLSGANVYKTTFAYTFFDEASYASLQGAYHYETNFWGAELKKENEEKKTP